MIRIILLGLLFIGGSAQAEDDGLCANNIVGFDTCLGAERYASFVRANMHANSHNYLGYTVDVEGSTVTAQMIFTVTHVENIRNSGKTPSEYMDWKILEMSRAPSLFCADAGINWFITHGGEIHWVMYYSDNKIMLTFTIDKC